MAYMEGDILVRDGLITGEQLRAALTQRSAVGGSLGQNLLRMGVIGEEALAHFYHKRLVLPLVAERRLEAISPAVLRLVPAEVAAEFRVVPMSLDPDGALYVAMADPSDNHAVEEIGFFVDRFVMRTVATESAIARALERHYGVAPRPRAMLPTEKPVSPPAAAPAKPLARVALVSGPVAGKPLDGKPVAAKPVAARPVPGKAATREPEAPTPATKDLVLFPANADERAYDPFGARGKRPAQEGEVVLLTKKVRSDETPLPPHAPPQAYQLAPPPPEEPLLLTQKRGRKRTGTLPGLHGPVPELPPLAELRAAKDRDSVANIVLDFAARFLGRAVLFVVRKEQLAGLDARGGGLDKQGVEILQIPLAGESLFREVVRSRLPFRGHLPTTPQTTLVARALEVGANAEIVLLPIAVRARVVAVLFGHRIERELPEASLQMMAYEAGLAYERILLQSRVPI